MASKYDPRRLARYPEHDLAHHVLFSASSATLRKLAKRKDKIGRAARQVLSWENTGRKRR